MQKNRVLIVDDMVVNTAILSSILKESGYDTVTAHSGEEALQKVREGFFDCILLDIIMPDMDGFEVIQHLKAIPAVASVPVIFITGEESLDSTVKGFELGAVDYIKKPFHHMEVRARLNAHIKLFSTIKSLASAQAETLKQIQQAQNSLLKKPEDLPDAHFHVLYESLHAAGGDIYDIIELSTNVYGYFVGDFAGHQISTGFLTSSVKALLQQNCTSQYLPEESMRIVNSVLCELMQVGQYLTGCYAVIDKNTNLLTVVNMGHPPLIFIPKYGKIREIGRGGDILGAFDRPIYRDYVVEMYPGDRLLIYTDGLIEGKSVWSANTQSLIDIVERIRESSRENFIERLYEETSTLRDVVDDDIMVLVADFPGESPSIEVERIDGKLTCKFKAIRRMIDPCIEIIEQQLKESGVDDNFAIKLALYEALGNAIRHGSKDDPKKDISVSLTYEDGELTIEVVDQGDGFDWESHKMIIADEYAPSGRGLTLFKAYGFNYIYKGGGNHLVLKKNY